MLNEISEADILSQIKNSEKNAEELIEKANKQKEVMVQDAINSSSKLLETKKAEIIKLQDKI